jgi:hypothetical protein
MKPKILCEYCREIFEPNPRVKNQRYCGKRPCQRARKTKWQREKITSDPDYRKNQKDAQDDWRKRHPGYWKKFRQKNPDYCTRNKQLQKVRDAKRRARHLAKMDTLNPLNLLSPGTYFLIPILADLAKMDASIQKVTLIPEGCGSNSPSCKRGLDGL